MISNRARAGAAKTEYVILAVAIAIAVLLAILWYGSTLQDKETDAIIEIDGMSE